MNRRSFFNKLGAAILGTAIALKLPDSIVPKVPELPKHPGAISFKMLNDAYNRALLGSKEPDFMIVNKAQYIAYMEMQKPHERICGYTPDGEFGVKFRNAVLLRREEDRLPEEISTGHIFNSGRTTYMMNC